MIDKMLLDAGLNRQAIAHGLRLALAALLAFSVASIFHVDNAFWAAMPVFVVAQPQRGLMLERAAFRILGTVAGIAAGLALLSIEGHAALMLGLLGVWVALSAFLVHMLRGVHGYGAMLSGISASVVVLPSLFHPETAFALAVSRAECTLIGVLCATLVIGLFTPPSERGAFYAEVRAIAREALKVAGLILGGQGAGQEEHKLFQSMASVQQRGVLVTAASAEGYRRLHHIEALLVQAMGVIGAARLAAGVEGERARHAAPLLERLGQTLQDEAARVELLARLEAAAPEIARDVQKLLAADAMFDTDPHNADARSFGSKAAYLAPHRDEQTAALVAALAGGATFASGYAGYLLGWPAAALAALGICNFAMLLGAMPRPRLVAPVVLRGVLAGVAMALVYRLLVQSHVETVPELILSLAPFVLFGSIVRASPRHAGWGLDLNMCFWLASQAKLPAVTNTAIILSEAAALTLAIILVVSAVLLMPEPMRQRARNAAASIRKSVMRIASGDEPVSLDKARARTARHFLRLALELEHVLDLADRASGSFGAILSLGRSLSYMRNMLAVGALSAAERAALEEALSAAAAMSLSPDQMAARFAAIADTLTDGEAARLLRCASASLESSRALLGLGLKPATV